MWASAGVRLAQLLQDGVQILHPIIHHRGLRAFDKVVGVRLEGRPHSGGVAAGGIAFAAAEDHAAIGVGLESEI